MKPKILIVDDRKENIFALEGTLEDLDVEIVSALSGNDAVAKTLRKEFAVILMDVQMPEMNGFEAVELIRREKKNQNTPIIFLSAIYKEELYQVKGIRAGAVDFLTKPLNEDILIGKIKIFIELYRQKIQLQELNSELNAANKKLEQLANTDGLTGVPNRYYFDETIKKEWLRSVRNGNYISLLMLDIDYFKLYNDYYGHLQGDACLQAVAAKLSETIMRPGDFVARYGGEEFIIVLTETDTNGAITVSKKIHEAVAQLNIEHMASHVSRQLTISIGIASTLATKASSYKKLLQEADMGLYQAKTEGRNRWKVYP